LVDRGWHSSHTVEKQEMEKKNNMEKIERLNEYKYIYSIFYMGCKFSISIVHPSNKSPTSKTLKIPESPIFEKKTIPDEPDSDSDSYNTLYIDTPPDSEKKRV